MAGFSAIAKAKYPGRLGFPFEEKRLGGQCRVRSEKWWRRIKFI